MAQPQPKLLHCEDSIQVYTSSFQENEIFLSQTISLNDPASLQRMQTPCRAFHCEHLQCFDFNVFVFMNKNKPFFKCPVCNKVRNPDKIYIDFVALSLLELYPSADSAKLLKSGIFQVSCNGLPVSKTAAIKGTQYFLLVINSIFDLKHLRVFPVFERESIRLEQFRLASIFDIAHIFNTASIEKLIQIISQPKERCLAYKSTGPFHYSSNSLLLSIQLQGVKGVGPKTAKKIIDDLTSHYESASLKHLELVSSGPSDSDNHEIELLSEDLSVSSPGLMIDLS